MKKGLIIAAVIAVIAAAIIFGGGVALGANGRLFEHRFAVQVNPNPFKLAEVVAKSSPKELKVGEKGEILFEIKNLSDVKLSGVEFFLVNRSSLIEIAGSSRFDLLPQEIREVKLGFRLKEARKFELKVRSTIRPPGSMYLREILVSEDIFNVEGKPSTDFEPLKLEVKSFPSLLRLGEPAEAIYGLSNTSPFTLYLSLEFRGDVTVLWWDIGGKDIWDSFDSEGGVNLFVSPGGKAEVKVGFWPTKVGQITPQFVVKPAW